MLVDSDVLIWYLRGDERAAQFLDGLPNLRLSAVTYMELMQGMRNKREFNDLQADLKSRNAVILPIARGFRIGPCSWWKPIFTAMPSNLPMR